MGTNYYMIENKCECCDRYDSTHIGKSSAGWTFTFNGLGPAQSWQDWKFILIGKEIQNEYGSIIPYEAFVQFVETTGSPDYIGTNGIKNLVNQELVSGYSNGRIDAQGYPVSYVVFC